MKKIYSALCAALLASTLGVNAQQITNADFEGTWEDTHPWNSENYSKTVGKHPQGWCISHVAGLCSGFLKGSGSTEVGSQTTGYNSTKAVKLINVANAYMKSQIVPGYLTLGTSWSTSITGKSNDGGSFGGIDFTHKPDALKFMYKCTRGDGSTQPATVVAYLWKGTYTHASVPASIVLSGSPKAVDMQDRDRSILGISTDIAAGTVTHTDGAECIARLNDNTTITATTSDWTAYEQPITYASNATPEKLNIIIAANNYFGSASDVHKDDEIDVDNVKLVYYSRLSALSVNGTAVADFAEGTYAYTVTGDLPEADAITYTVKGQEATATVTRDEAAKTITVTVTNVDADSDGQSTHSYVITFEPEQTPTYTGTEYAGKLTVKMGDDNTIVDNQDQTVTITDTDANGKCTFVLPNFAIDLGDGPATLGDIVVPNVTVTENPDGSHSYSGAVSDMSLLGGEIIADVTLTGTISADGKTFSFNIPVLCKMDEETTFTISVTFCDAVTATSGIGSIDADDAVEAPAEYYDLTGRRIAASQAHGVVIVKQGNKARKVVL